LDAGTAAHALPGLSDDVFSEVTALEVILLRGCLNITEGGLGDESFIQQGPSYVQVPREIPLPLWHGTPKRRDDFGDEDKRNYTNYIPIITIISSTSEFLIFPDAKMTGRIQSSKPTAKCG
jgi:hypothetical protein